MVPFFGATAGPLLSSLFAVPLITWYPLFMVWFGLGTMSKIVYAAVSGFFPIAINTMNGIRGLDPPLFTVRPSDRLLAPPSCFSDPAANGDAVDQYPVCGSAPGWS